ncbi:MAG: ABC transporter permease [Acidimicrobiales bacterium]
MSATAGFYKPSFVGASVAVWRRGLIRTLRIPAILVQSFFFPGFFLIVYVGLYKAVTQLPGFPTDNIANWYLPFMMIQGAAFSGVGAGFATAVDIDNGFFDRLMLMPGSRHAITIGTTAMALTRALTVAAGVFVIGLIAGARPTDAAGLLLTLLAIVSVSAMASWFALGLVYRVKDQRVAPLFPIAIFVVLFVSTAQVPLDLTTGWLTTAAEINPMTRILGLARTGFVDSGVTWSDTWPGLVAIGGCCGLLGLFAWRGMRRYIP